MISIKVCKLSDLINGAIIILVSCLFLFFTYYTILKLLNKISFDFIKLSIGTNLCVKNDEDMLKQMIFSNLPINILNYKDDIEKEFNIADNSNSDNNNKDIHSEHNSSNKGNNLGTGKISNNIFEKINTKLKFPYLLACEKISDSKYKIGDVIINDYTKKQLDFNELEKSLFTELGNDCKVLIYHTHTSESYTGINEYSDTYRTEDNDSNVVKVGEALKDALNQYGIFVRHDTTLHDYPSYNGAYKSSLNTVENILKNENYDIIIDIHRDALASNSQYRPTAEINGETVAKLMFVVGTNAAGLKHDNWIENLKFAISMQQRANELFPGLFRDLHLSTSRYNQHTSDKTVILEVGATGNTIDEACLSMKYFAALIKLQVDN